MFAVVFTVNVTVMPGRTVPPVPGEETIEAISEVWAVQLPNPLRFKAP